jgi:RHS repeat-associated protein
MLAIHHDDHCSDKVSRLTSLTDPRGFSTLYNYDPLNRVTSITDAQSGVTGFGYDPNGNLLTVTDAKNQTTSYTYDNMDRLATRMDPLTRQESYTYDFNGNLLTFTDRKNQVSTFTYDALNRRINSTYADSSATVMSYDQAGRLAAAEDSTAGRIEFSYDILDRLTQELTPQGTVAYGYDVLGRRTSMTANGQASTSYGYDDASRLTAVNQGTQTVGLGYDNAGHRTSLTYPNGVNTVYSYDNASRLTNITHQGPSALIDSLTYNYDTAGNRISTTRANGTATDLPQAVQAAYDAANEEIQFNNATPNLTYDANGNLTSQADVNGTTTYTWDARNRLISISGPSVSASFEYDALGRRTSKTINGTTTEYQYDGNDIIAEIGGDAVGATYLRSLNIDEPFIRQGNADEYYHTDALGSILALSDQTGTVQSTYQYEAFGETTISGTSTNPFQYTGRENDDTGLYYNRARYYSSTLKRFLSEDLLSIEDLQILRQSTTLNHLIVASGDIFYQSYLRDPKHFNSYSYVQNSPVLFKDPNGLWSLSFEAYDGLGGGFIFGKNPGGGWFITWRVGKGVGGGISFDPFGSSPGWDSRKPHGLLNIGFGGFGEAGVGLGPLGFGLSVQGGVNAENPGGYKPYFDVSPEASISLEKSLRLKGEAATGIEISIYE